MDVFKDNKGAWSPKNPPSMGSVLRAVFGAVVAVLLIVAAFTSYYTVDTEEQSVVLRFGKYMETANPGLHFKIPFGVDQAIAVPVEKVRKEEFGYETASAGVRTKYKNRTSEVQDTALMLTGDLNIADVEWVVQYKIKNAQDWVFNVRNQVAAIRDLSESVMRMVVGDHTITEVVTKRERIKPLVKKALQEAVDD